MSATLVCPFCKSKLSSVDDESLPVVKRFMGLHLAKNHEESMEVELYRLHHRKPYHPAEQGQIRGFKRGL